MATNNLPYEIIHLILSQLSNRHLINTSLVCQTWALISRYCMYQHIYIHSNRQLKLWLISLKKQQKSNSNLTQSNNGSYVKTLLFHPQVKLLQQDLELLQSLCPLVESFSIKTTNNTSMYTILPAWKYTKHLTSCHNDSLTVWLPNLYSQLTSAVFNCHDTLTIFSYINHNNSINSNITEHHHHHRHTLYHFPNMNDLQLDFSYMKMDLYILLEKLHLSCPKLKKLTLTSVSLTMDHSSSSSTITLDHPNFNYKNNIFYSPADHLTSLSLYDSTIDDEECYSYFFKKYPKLDTFHMDFMFGEFYNATFSDHTHTCLFLKTCRYYLYNFLTKKTKKNNDDNNNKNNDKGSSSSSSSFSSLKSISLHFNGAPEFIETLWSGKEFTQYLESSMESMNENEYQLEYLDLNYARQTNSKKDILGLEYILKSKAVQKLKGLSLNVYNNDDNHHHKSYNHPFYSLLPSTSFIINSDAQHFPFLTKLCLSSYPGFNLNLIQLLNRYPHLKIINLQYATLHHSCQEKKINESSSSFEMDKLHHDCELQELSLSSSTVLDLNEWMQLLQRSLPKLTSLNCENITFKYNQSLKDILLPRTNVMNFDLTNHGIKKLWLKHLTLVGLVDDVQKENKESITIEWLKVEEQGYSMTSWYDGSINNHHCNKMYGSSTICCKYDHLHHNYNNKNLHDHENNYYIQVTCQYAEDILIC